MWANSGDGEYRAACHPSLFNTHCCCCCIASVVSNSVRPHRQQPTRLPCPWDSPGKITGVDCHFLLQCMKVKSEIEVAQSCPTPSDSIDYSLPGSSVHGIFQARVLEGVAISFSIQYHSRHQLFFLLFLATPHSLWDLSSQPEIQPGPSAVKAQSTHHRTTRNFLDINVSSPYFSLLGWSGLGLCLSPLSKVTTSNQMKIHFTWIRTTILKFLFQIKARAASKGRAVSP